jgi:hypothetical protein
LNKSYPKTAPLIEVTDVKGLSQKEIDELKSILSQTANNCLGEVMIHEVAVVAENYLEDHNRKPETLHEQMQNRQRNAAAALKDIKNGSLFAETSKEMKINEFSEGGGTTETTQARTPLDLRKQAHGGDRAGSVGSEEGEDWLQSLLKRQHGLTMGGFEGDDPSDDESTESIEKTTYQADGNSRYQKEFQELTLLGKGAGGEVWKVKNSLDRRAYAVKKILLNPTNEPFNRKIRREVTTISRLLHKNIVRYYAAWMEDVIPVGTLKANSLTRAEYSSSIDGGILQHYLPKGTNSLTFSVEQFQDLNTEFDMNGLATIASSSSESEDEVDDSSDASSTLSSSDDDDDDDCLNNNMTPADNASWGHIEFIDSTSDDENHESTDRIENENEEELESSAESVKPRLPTRLLYIQMEFCDATLRAAIDGGLFCSLFQLKGILSSFSPR